MILQWRRLVPRQAEGLLVRLSSLCTAFRQPDCRFFSSSRLVFHVGVWPT